MDVPQRPLKGSNLAFTLICLPKRAVDGRDQLNNAISPVIYTINFDKNRC